MAETPRGTRNPDEEYLFKQPTSDPTIKPDKITAAVEGYFRLPAIWVGEPPEENSVLQLNPQVHHSAVITRPLNCGISVRALRDGTFLFDFSDWPPAKRVEIPGYRTPGLQVPHYPAKEHEEAEQRAERIAAFRAQVMNVHQACLATSQWLLRRNSTGVGLPVTSAEALKGLTFEEALLYRYNAGNNRDIIRSVMNNNATVPEVPTFHRHVLEIDVVEHAMDLFDDIVSSKESAMVQMIEAVYLAAYRCQEGRFGEAIVLAWGVCEQLLAAAWARLLDCDGVSSDRRKRLQGRDYSASVKTEFLQLVGAIELPVYQQLEQARKARNKWAHEMREPSPNDVRNGVKAAQDLLEMLYDYRLSIPLIEATPSVPGWYVWIGQQ